MVLVNWWKVVVLERFAQFTGRAGRAEYWWFFLANLIVALVLALLSRASVIFLILYVIYGVGVLVPSIAVGVRRLHDTDKSGWFMLIALIPFVGYIILLVLLAMEGTPGSNRYGPPPPGEPALA
jgi:uncharacterized membrane protein YhaH (DUF805 family)